MANSNNETSTLKNANDPVIGKTAVVGDKDSILVFKALGMDIFSASEPYKTRDILKFLIAKEYSVILITETQAEKVSEFLNTRKSDPYPIIIPIPDVKERTGYGMRKVKENLEKVGGSTARQQP